MILCSTAYRTPPWAVRFPGIPAPGARLGMVQSSTTWDMWWSRQARPPESVRVMQFGIFSVGDVTPDPTNGRVPTEAERIRSMTRIALKAEEVGLDVFA